MYGYGQAATIAEKVERLQEKIREYEQNIGEYKAAEFRHLTLEEKIEEIELILTKHYFKNPEKTHLQKYAKLKLMRDLDV